MLLECRSAIIRSLDFVIYVTLSCINNTDVGVSDSLISEDSISELPLASSNAIPFETPPVSPTDGQKQPTRKRRAQGQCKHCEYFTTELLM